MSTWPELAKDNRTAAWELFERGRHRATASRAYYSIYSEITGRLIEAGVTMPAGRNNPAHVSVPLLIQNHLYNLSIQKRGRLAGLVDRLYTLRVIADYRPDMTLGQAEATICLTLLTHAWLCLKDVP